MIGLEMCAFMLCQHRDDRWYFCTNDIAVGLWPSDAKYSLQIIIWRRVTQQNNVTPFAGTGKRTVYKEPSYLVFYRMIVAWCQNGAKTQKELIFWKAYIEKLQE